MQGSGRKRPAWFTLLFFALVVPLWVMMFMMFLNPKRTQQGQQEQTPKQFPTLQEVKQVEDINQAIRVWKEQVEGNPKAPDADLTLLKVAIANEYVLQPPDYGAAFRAYQRLGEGYKRSPFATHALFRAAQIAEQPLGERELARKLYEKIGGSQRKPAGTVVWRLSGDQFVPALQGQVLTAEAHRVLDGYYRDGALYRALSALVRFCGNDKRYSYGLALLLTAILVQGFLWLLPFTRKQYETMRKMQEMAPEIKKIQETFKADPRRMQQEVFGLYKRQHFNPMTGCFLGMLIQMPFLWAVFAAIRHFQYPLSDASFLWVKSLAQPDLPLLVLYCGSMYLTTRYGPGSDPSQAQQQKTMAWLMPVMFFFFFRSWPSGFLLYWLATNLLSMGQRYLIMHKPAQPAGVQPESAHLPAGAYHSPNIPVLAGAAELRQADCPPAEDSTPTEELPSLSEAQVAAAAPLEGDLRRGAPLSRGTRRGGKGRRRRPVTGKKGA